MRPVPKQLLPKIQFMYITLRAVSRLLHFLVLQLQHSYMNTPFRSGEVRIQFTPAKTIPIRLINLRHCGCDYQARWI
jgi:hypothetical protein